jgi:small GTP-binding protein
LKIGILGLDNSGKSTLLSVIQNRYTTLDALKPTKGIDRKIETIFGKEISLWDYGGQEIYRKKYLDSKDDLTGLQLIFYLIDIQTPERYTESIDYLKAILTKIEKFDQSHLVILFHKVDSDKRDKLVKSIEQVKKLLEPVAPKAAYRLETSSLDQPTIFRAFSLGLREVGLSSAFLRETLNTIRRKTDALAIAILGLDSPYLIDSDADDQSLLFPLENLGIDYAKLSEKEKIGDLKGNLFIFFKLEVEVDEYFLIAAFKNDGDLKSKVMALRKECTPITEQLSLFAW